MARGSAAGGRLPARNRDLPSSKSPAPPPLDSDLRPAWNPPRRFGRVRFAGAGGRRSGPPTPLLRWNLNDAAKHPLHGGEENVARQSAPKSSVRKLAAAIWHLRPPEVTGGGGVWGHGLAPVGIEQAAPRHLQTHQLKPSSTKCHPSLKNEISSPISVLDPNNGGFHKMQLDASATLPLSVTEKATKWDPGSSQASDNALQLASTLNFVEDIQGTHHASTLQLELQQAHARISELEVEQLSTKKKLDHFLKKLGEEKAAWRSREHEKVRAVIDGMKTDLDKEKKNRRRLEIINSKLVNEVRETKLSAKQFMQDYEKETEARELVEEVCDELAMEAEEDKAKIAALKQELVKIRGEVDEERKMLQMAEVWREERVQMKLVDAKLTLESKYSQLSKLQHDLETFLSAQKCSKSVDIGAVREADHLMQAVDSLKLEEIKQFAYEPPPESEDIFSIFEELRPREDQTETKQIEMDNVNSPPVRISEIHAASPEADVFLEKPAKMCANGNFYDESDVDDISSWETVSRDEKGSSNSPEGSERYVKVCEGNQCLASGNEPDENRNTCRLNDEVFQDCSASMNLPKKKESALSRLWKPSRTKNCEGCKKDAIEIANGRPSNGRISNATYSTEVGSHEIRLSPLSLGHWSSPDSLNLHFSRGFRGCIECPRAMQKHSLKAKLLEARMVESQKIQLRHVLKQKF